MVNKFQSATSFSTKKSSYNEINSEEKSIDEIKKELRDEINIKQQVFPLSQKYIKMLAEIIIKNDEEKLYKKDLLRRYVEDGIKRDYRKIKDT